MPTKGMWGNIQFGGRTAQKRPALTDEQRRTIREDADAMREANPGISKAAIGRALATKHGVSGSTVLQTID